MKVENRTEISSVPSSHSRNQHNSPYSSSSPPQTPRSPATPEFRSPLCRENDTSTDARAVGNKKSLIYPAIYGSASDVEECLKRGDNVNSCNDASQSALWCASHYENLANVKVLLKIKDIEVDCEDEQNITPVLEAALGGHVEVVKLLLANRADINRRDKQYRMTLFFGQ
ncbi:ankyrin repeat domain-containing protein [Aspergillus stella-maris]|uniref:ankyrin repeat domain-containing protein n=1 Tax=Aspergillus stella-maris TaxID=1810926 RepID=UPI003CCDEADA